MVCRCQKVRQPCVSEVRQRYGNQVHEQLKTISNRTEFLSEEVESHRREAAGGISLSRCRTSEADDQARQLAREARFVH